MNAVLEYIKTRKTYSIYGLSTALCQTHDLCAIHNKVSGDNLLHLSRRKSNYIEDDDIHNDTTLTVFNEQLDVISMAPPLAEKYTLESASILPITDDSPIAVSELLIGKLVTVSLYKQTYILSTKDSIHAKDQIAPGIDKSTQEIFLDLMDRIDPYSGLEGLFRMNRGGINCRNFSYTFVLSPRSGKFTDNFLDYDMYLVSLYNRDIHRFMSPIQIESICNQLNGASTTYKIKQPTYKKIYSITQLNDTVGLLTKKPYVRGLYLIDEYMNTGYIVIKHKNSINIEKRLQKLISVYLKQDYLGIIQIKTKYPEIGELISNFLITYKDSASMMYSTAARCRTRRAFYERVCGHRAEIILYALYSGKIKHLNELHKIITPSKIARMIIDECGIDRIKKLIKN